MSDEEPQRQRRRLDRSLYPAGSMPPRQAEASSSPPEPSNVQRLRCFVSYDGTDFHGFQLQDGDLDTVQRRLEWKLSSFLKCSVRVHPSGRTDAGVHARAQVIHFDCPLSFFEKGGTCEKLQGIFRVRLSRPSHAALAAIIAKYITITTNHRCVRPTHTAALENISEQHVPVVDMHRKGV